jgi:hypothetical protein
MRERKLSREDALAEYFVYRVRTVEHLQMLQILLDLKERRYVPENPFTRNPTETVQHMLLGLFASLMDSSRQALNVFDVWVVLYPSEKTRIEETWSRIETHVRVIRDLRNNISFHAAKDLGNYVRALRTYEENAQAIGSAMREFGKLAGDLFNREPEALPNLRDEAGPVLRKAGVAEEYIERFKDYFL